VARRSRTLLERLAWLSRRCGGRYCSTCPYLSQLRPGIGRPKRPLRPLRRRRVDGSRIAVRRRLRLATGLSPWRATVVRGLFGSEDGGAEPTTIVRSSAAQPHTYDAEHSSEATCDELHQFRCFSVGVGTHGPAPSPDCLGAGLYLGPPARIIHAFQVWLA
jgi:hypothetical protein